MEIKGTEAYINSQAIVKDLEAKKGGFSAKRESVDDESLLDIAEVCFLRIADVLIKRGQTVREAFKKYSIPEVVGERNAVLDLLSPPNFFKALVLELGILEF